MSLGGDAQKGGHLLGNQSSVQWELSEILHLGHAGEQLRPKKPFLICYIRM